MSDLIELIYKFGAEHGVDLGQDPSGEFPSPDDGSDGSPEPPSTQAVAAEPIEPASGGPVEAGAIEADHPDTAAPASVDPYELALREKKRACIEKFLNAATDPTLPNAKDRQNTVAFAKDAWKAELPTELEFVRACTDTANKVVKSELKEAAARKYLESLI
jgi:hypothetical protein